MGIGVTNQPAERGDAVGADQKASDRSATGLHAPTQQISDRIPAVPRAQWTEATREVFAVYGGEKGGESGSKFNVFQLCAHHPQLTAPFLRFNKNLLQNPVIPGRLREIVVLRVAWRNRCEYEWVRHVEIAAQEFGLGPEHIEAVKTGAEHPIWSDLERQALRAVDQLAETSTVDEPTWNALAERFGHAEMLELLFLVGTYTLLAWVFNATGLRLEPDTVADTAFA